MSWSKEDREALLAFKDTVDCDDVKVKEQIKKVLLNNRFIVHVLNNKELQEAEAEPDEYFGENIRPSYIIPETQTETKNFLCYTVSYKELDRYNKAFKKLQIVFYILCHQQDLIDKETGIARHDLLAALVQDQFNYTTYIGGGRLIMTSSVEQVVDTNYCTRVLTFEQDTDANVVKTRNGISRFANKDIQPHI